MGFTNPRWTAKENGIGIVKDLHSEAARANILIMMLPDSPDVKEVILASNGLIHYIHPHSVIIDMGSINPLTSNKIAAAFDEKGKESLDAPVSGGVKGATEGTLSIMVGGKKETIKQIQPILKMHGKNPYLCRSSWQRASCKAVQLNYSCHEHSGDMRSFCASAGIEFRSQYLKGSIDGGSS